MNILGIESSCDETASAVVRDGREVLSSTVYTQIPLHQPYGGVVPEVASRAHVEKISGVILDSVRAFAQREGVSEAEALRRIDAVAVTYGPGLASSLIVGLSAAKGLAAALGKPLVGINHIEAHLHTPFLFDAGEAPEYGIEESFPALGLAVSGGHTCWVDMPECGRYRIIGQTLDDAAGEAFDKAAKLLELGYPGGPKIDRIARDYWASRGIDDYSKLKDFKSRGLVDFPKGHPRQGTAALAGLDADLCVSFSGLKTSLLRYVERTPGWRDDIPRIVASYQEAIVAAIADRTARALGRREYRALVLGGGVSLNGRLRSAMGRVAKAAKVKLLAAKPKYCGDNAAMIAALAAFRRNLEGERAMRVDVHPSLEAGDEV